MSPVNCPSCGRSAEEMCKLGADERVNPFDIGKECQICGIAILIYREIRDEIRRRRHVQN